MHLFISIVTGWEGLLIAACINRAPPGTFGAAIADVGLYDMLRVSRLCSTLLQSR